MERQINLNEVSDGKLYGLDDMVRADCAGCAGCSACCRGMGRSVVLDPLDVHRLTSGTGMSVETLLHGYLELNVVDGIILPNLRMAGGEEACMFLNEEGRCKIHAYRPGICRIFPLGRLYEDGSFRYFLQIHECARGNRSKIKVKKWIDTPDGKTYDRYISDWHYFLKDLQRQIENSMEESAAKTVCMYVLKQFYLTPFDGNRDFYTQFYDRLESAAGILF